MKLLRNGFAFIVALLTISLTIAAREGAFKSETKEVKNVQRVCNPETQQLAAPDQPRLKTGCALVDPCPTNIPAAQLYGIVSADYPQFNCPDTDDIFCCAVLNLNQPVTCPTGPNGFQVVSYLCGEPEIQ